MRTLNSPRHWAGMKELVKEENTCGRICMPDILFVEEVYDTNTRSKCGRRMLHHKWQYAEAWQLTFEDASSANETLAIVFLLVKWRPITVAF